jgi:hypothetical protein
MEGAQWIATNAAGHQWSDHLAFPLCTSKQKQLTTNGQNIAAVMLLKQKQLVQRWWQNSEKRGGKK